MQECWEANSSRIGRKNLLARKVIQNKGRITKGLLVKVSSTLGYLFLKIHQNKLNASSIFLNVKFNESGSA